MESLHSALSSCLGDGYLGWVEHRGETTFRVKAETWLEAAEILKKAGYSFLTDLTAVDYVGFEPRFALLAILLSMEEHAILRLQTMLPGENPEVVSLTSLWSGAGWFEREIYDLFGITFVGHPDLRRILLPDDYEGHPLRKDFPVTGPLTSVYR